MNLILITAGSPNRPNVPAVQQLRLLMGAGAKASKTRAVHLLVVDTRRMNAACLDAALEEVAVINRSLGFNLGVLACRLPTLKLTVAAMRAGLHDIIHEPLGARRVRNLVRTAMPGVRISLAEFSPLAALLRAFVGRPAVRELPTHLLARRELDLARRSEQLENIEKRLAFDRAVLDARDQELRACTRRLEREWVRLQTDADITPVPTTPAAVAPFTADLHSLAHQLEQRARDLGFREKLLREMEALLAANTMTASRAAF